MRITNRISPTKVPTDTTTIINEQPPLPQLFQPTNNRRRRSSGASSTSSSFGSQSLCLEVKPYVQNHDGHTVTYSSNGEGFPIQVEGSENNHVYNQMFLRDIETNDVPAIIIQDDSCRAFHSRRRRSSYPPHQIINNMMYNNNEESPIAATFRIYAFKPKFEGQKPVKRNSYSSSLLYEWARVEQQSSLMGTTSYAMWTGESNEQRTGIPTYVARPIRSPLIMIPLLLLGGGIRYYRPHSIKVLHNNNANQVCATIMGKPGSENWHLELLDANLDSALFIAFMAIIDEIIINDYKRRMKICEEY